MQTKTLAYHFLPGWQKNIKDNTTLYQIPIAAVTNCCKFSSLKQTEFVLLQFWSSEVGKQSRWAKVKVLHSWFLLQALRKIPFLPFLATRAPFLTFLGSWPFLHLQSQQPQHLQLSLGFHSHITFCFSDLMPLFYKDPCDSIRPIWIIQDSLPIKILNLIPTSESLLSYRLAFRSSRDWDLGRYYSANHTSLGKDGATKNSHALKCSTVSFENNLSTPISKCSSPVAQNFTSTCLSWRYSHTVFHKNVPGSTF